jgi:hypothetical protein
MEGEMKMVGMKNLALVILLACFFHNGQQICLDPQGGGIDTGNPKGEPTNDPTKPAKMKQRLEEMQLILPSDLLGGGSETVGPKTKGGTDTIARGGQELGPKIIKT